MTNSPKKRMTLAELAEHQGLIFAKREQPILFVLIFFCLIGMGVWTHRLSSRLNHVIDIDQRVPKIATFQVDLNRATWVEISCLPSIGESLAKEIVAYREEVGSFHSVEAVQLVSGIGPRTFQEISPYLAPIAPDAIRPSNSSQTASTQ